MLDARKKIIIGGGVLLLLLVAFLFIALYLRPVAPDDAAGTVVVENAPNPTQVAPAPLPADQVLPAVPVGAIDASSVAKQTARTFVERFGTYSSQNDNEHITLVLPASTNVMSSWLRSQSVTQGGPFVGRSTEVLASSLTSLTDAAAEVAVQVRQVNEENGTVTTEVLTGRVELVAGENDTWLVDGLYYE